MSARLGRSAAGFTLALRACALPLLLASGCAPTAPPLSGDGPRCSPASTPTTAVSSNAPASNGAAPGVVVAHTGSGGAQGLDGESPPPDVDGQPEGGEPLLPPVGPMVEHPDIIEFRSPGTSARCGDFVVGPLVGMPDKMGVAVTRADGRLLAQYVPRMGIDAFFPAYCGDLAGDGSEVLLLRYTTGGAHCCHTELVVRLGEPPEPLGSFDMDDGGYATPRKLRPGGAFQLVMDDRILVSTSAPFPSFAATPGLPMILDYDGHRYRVQTHRFPDAIREARAALLAEIGTCERGDTMCDDARGAYIAATAHLLGDWAAQRGTLSSTARATGERVIAELRSAGR